MTTKTKAIPTVDPTVSWTTATAIVVADMVGVGVFTSLGFQVSALNSPFVLLFLWFLGGIIALCGAFCYAELAAMFPRSSGEYNFLARSYSPATGFLAGWLSATVGFAAPVALAAMAFGEYARAIAPGAPPLALGVGVIWATSVFHLLGVKQGGAFQIASTLLKLLLILAFLAAGFSVRDKQPLVLAPSALDLGQVFSAPFAISLVFVMYSYSGWNAATYIADEIKEPGRNLPKALFSGTAIVILLYVALNAVFLYSAPMSELAGQVNVAQIAAGHIFGEAGGRIVGGLIALGLISSISAMMWIGPRVTMVMGEDLPLLRAFSRKSANGAPRAAILLQLAVATALLLTQSFEAVLEFIQFSLAFCSFLTVLGMVKLRLTRPDLPRPYRAWGYPLTPIVFLSATAFMMYYLLTTKPLQSLAGLALMFGGLLLYGLINMQQASVHKAVSKVRVWAFFAALLALGVGVGRAEAGTADDTARFLAGLPVPANSPLAPLTNEPSWKYHASHFDAAFRRAEDRQLSKIRAWSKANVAVQRPTLFYLFSGPDYLYAGSFFPEARTYVLAGLEPVGAIPEVGKVSKAAAYGVLRSLEASLQSILNVSFFKTKDMQAQLRASPINGTLPVLYVFLARSGKTIQDVALVQLDANGEAHVEQKPDGKSGATGAKITFSSPGGPMQTLYYFSANVANGSFKKQGLEPFMQKLGEGSALIKSASYLLHGSNFSEARKFLLGRSASIVQDDTGVPVSMFGPDWRLQPFGRYLGPIGLFSGMYQPRLAALFRAHGAAPLPFGVGYRWRPNESNLLYAVKKADAPANVAPPAPAPIAAPPPPPKAP